MESIVSAIIGVVCIIIGCINRTGNVSLLHSYHRKRVSEEDMLPFGKAVGIGMIIIGVSLLVHGVLIFLASYFTKSAYSVAANAVLIVGLAVGTGITFYAMFKYNKGIF